MNQVSGHLQYRVMTKTLTMSFFLSFVTERARLSQYDKFAGRIEALPRFQMRYGKLRKNKDGSFEQKRVDILLAVELVRLSWSGQIGYAVIVTGDSDFVPAIEAAKDAGIMALLLAPLHPR